MALTKEQLTARRLGIGGSDAAKIVNGEWYDLWLNKTDRKEDDDLSDVWPVQLGVCTEDLNLDWYGRKTGNPALRRGEVVIHPKHKFLRCTLDGFDKILGRVVQAKHVNGFSKIDDVRAKYQYQVQHESLCCGASSGVLSVIIGAQEPALELIELDDFWATEYVEKCRAFWGYVERDEEPPHGKPMEVTPLQPVVMRVVSMDGNNAWASAAADWLNHGTAAKLFDASVKDMKAMIEPDVRQASGYGVVGSRSKAGAISFKKEK